MSLYAKFTSNVVQRIPSYNGTCFIGLDILLVRITIILLLLLSILAAFSFAIVVLQNPMNYLKLWYPRGTPKTPSSVNVSVIQYPAGNSSPTIEILPTVSKEPLNQGPDVFPSHTSVIWRFWNVPGNLDFQKMRPEGELSLLKGQGNESTGLYLALYSTADVLPENHCVPESFRPGKEVKIFGDALVVKLRKEHCGWHGWDMYEDIPAKFLEMDCFKRKLS